MQVVSFFIRKGASVNICDANGCTPLHFSAGGGYLEVVKVLVTAGAFVDSQDLQGKTPLHWASRNGHEGKLES